MREPGQWSFNASLVLFSLAAIIFLYGAFAPGAQQSQKVFDYRLGKSLIHLDHAKQQWAEEHSRLQEDVPTMNDLIPYLEDRTNLLAQMVALGITYTLTSLEEPQSDIATLTRDIRFRNGVGHLYPAGATYSEHHRWTFPQYTTTSYLRALYINNQYRLAGVLSVLATINFILFVMRRLRSPKPPPLF